MLKHLQTELKLRGFSERTVQTYLYQNEQFLKFNNKKPEEIHREESP